MLGLRPEHMHIDAGPESGHTDAIDAAVELVEPMGADSLVWLNVAAAAAFGPR